MPRRLILDFDVPGRPPEAQLLAKAHGLEPVHLPLWVPGPTSRRTVHEAEWERIFGQGDVELIASIECQSLVAVQEIFRAAKRRGIRTVWIEHGNLDARYVAKWCQGRALYTDRVACMGPASAQKYAELWGNERVSLVGYPGVAAGARLRPSFEARLAWAESGFAGEPGDSFRPEKVLDIVAPGWPENGVSREGADSVLLISSPGWTPGETNQNVRAICHAAAAFVRRGIRVVVRTKNRLDKTPVYVGLSTSGIPAHHTPATVTGPLLAQLAHDPRIGWVCGVESTALLEAAMAGLPVLRLALPGTIEQGTWHSQWTHDVRQVDDLERAVDELLSAHDPDAQDALLYRSALPAWTLL